MANLVTTDREAKAARRAALETELERLVALLAAMPDIEKVVLFGSLAAGQLGRASDIDLIVVRRTTKRFLDRIGELIDDLRPQVGVDLLVYTPEEFRTLSAERPFIQRAVAEGRILHEA